VNVKIIMAEINSFFIVKFLSQIQILIINFYQFQQFFSKELRLFILNY
jgi:hypothetical protein